MYDVVVVGAGPSGLNASRRLSEQGLKVLVLEKKQKLGEHVICTGIVGEQAFQEFGLSRGSILKEIRRIKAVSPFSSSLFYEHPTAFACVVDRRRFDNELGDAAREKGAEIKLESEVVEAAVEKNCIEIMSEAKEKFKEKHYARMAIVATGINFKLQKKLGLGYPRNFLKGVQAELNICDGDYTQVFLGNDVAPGAFAWLVPMSEGKVRMGLMTEQNPRQCFELMVEKFFPEIKLGLKEERVQFRPIAQGLVSKTYAERVLALGEAAGQVKTTTGGGIYFGLLCSEIAARVVLSRFEKGDFQAAALSEYERLWKKAIKKEILLGYYARKIYGKMNNAQIEKIFQIARNDGIIPLMREKGNFDWHSNLILEVMKRIAWKKIIKIARSVRI